MATKLLLVQDVDDLGTQRRCRECEAGFARNYLIPHGFAKVADKRTLRMQARLQQERAVRAAEDRREAEAQAAQLAEIQLSTVVKVDQEGNMYGSVSAHDIMKLLAEQAKVEVEKKSVQLKHAIKELGIHRVPLRLKEGVEVTIGVKVMTEDGNYEPITRRGSAKEVTAEEEAELEAPQE